MKILFFGDVVGQPGRQAIKKILPQWQKKYSPDFVIANADNLAHGKGVTQNTLDELLEAGIDLFTSGDHIWSKKEQATQALENKKIPLIRPANMSKDLPGQGYYILKLRTKKILVINLVGHVFMKEEYDNPFKKIDQILELEDDDFDAIIIDFHAEATAEKICLGWHLDGRVSAILGTHTHIPTADAKILPKGTAYITDVGMVGPNDSSLGVVKQRALDLCIEGTPLKYEVATGPVEINAVLVEIGKDKKAKKIKLLQETVAL